MNEIVLEEKGKRFWKAKKQLLRKRKRGVQSV